MGTCAGAAAVSVHFGVVHHPIFACTMCKCPCQLIFNSCVGKVPEYKEKLDMFLDKLHLIAEINDNEIVPWRPLAEAMP